MNTSQFDACDSAHDAEVEAQLCAYNSVFDELGLRFRWDASTLALLVTIDGEEARIAAYIEAHHPHLLKAYSAGFLSQAILERKNARCPACMPRRADSAAHLSDAAHQPQTNSWRVWASYEVELPALAGA
ncbi:hypothetical protein [Paraburkholderia elongata]|uniref:Uncharacterized protein n=1 Tax=Paraburkholderia elongata TaxID=2675747 RepID=A0A972SP16_9BURK|nr:hypothetical protein [Paraburkholderia elongata]NPT61812.1 hypothetical protein [Paraburkholderia elongata]